MKETIIFLDGELLKAKPKFIDQLAPWHLSGQGVFETMLAENGVIVFLEEHLRRLSKSLKILGFQNPFTRKQLVKKLYVLLSINYLQQARIRLTIWRDRGKIRIAILLFPLDQNTNKSFCVKVYTKRMKIAKPSKRIKSINYRFFVDAYQQAKRRGFDEAIILNEKEEVAEASRSNIFIIKNNRLLTPPLSSGCLSGIVRQVILSVAQQQKLKVIQKKLRRTDLQQADEIFLTNSVGGVVPVKVFENRKIAPMGRWTKKLRDRYQAYLRRYELLRGL